MFQEFFDIQSVLMYLLGFVVFLATLLDDIINPKKQTHKFAWYLQEFLYTIISIALGISICYSFDTSKSICWIVSIVAGLCGSSFIRKFRLAKDELADTTINSVKDKIEHTIGGHHHKDSKCIPTNCKKCDKKFDCMDSPFFDENQNTDNNQFDNDEECD